MGSKRSSRRNMQKNIGKTDRIIRVIVGFAIIGGGFYYGSWWGIVGLIPLVTAAIGWCSLYSVIGISTCKTDKPQNPASD